MSQGNSVHGNGYGYLCIKKKEFSLMKDFFKDEFSLRALYLSETVPWSLSRDLLSYSTYFFTECVNVLFF